MKGHAYNLLIEFRNTNSPFLFAQLILEIGTQQLDRVTPELDDEAVEQLLAKTMQHVRQSYERRRHRLLAVSQRKHPA